MRREEEEEEELSFCYCSEEKMRDAGWVVGHGELDDGEGEDDDSVTRVSASARAMLPMPMLGPSLVAPRPTPETTTDRRPITTQATQATQLKSTFDPVGAYKGTRSSLSTPKQTANLMA